MALNAAVTPAVVKAALQSNKVLDALVHELHRVLPALTFSGSWDAPALGGAGHTDLIAEIVARYSVA